MVWIGPTAMMCGIMRDLRFAWHCYTGVLKRKVVGLKDVKFYGWEWVAKMV